MLVFMITFDSWEKVIRLDMLINLWLCKDMLHRGPSSLKKCARRFEKTSTSRNVHVSPVSAKISIGFSGWLSNCNRIQLFNC